MIGEGRDARYWWQGYGREGRGGVSTRGRVEGEAEESVSMKGMLRGVMGRRGRC